MLRPIISALPLPIILYTADTDTGATPPTNNVYRGTNRKAVPWMTDQEIGEGYLAWGKAINDDCKVSDWQQAAAIAKAIAGEGKAVDMKRAVAVSKGDPQVWEDEVLDDVPPRPINAGSYDVEAVTIGSSMDETAMKHWSETADADQRNRGAPLYTASDLVRLLGLKKVLALPFPGTNESKPETWLYPGWNGPFDTRKGPDDKPVHFSPTIYDASVQGQGNRRFNELCKKIGKAEEALSPGEANEFEKLQLAQGMVPDGVKTAKQCAESKSALQTAMSWNDNRRTAVVRSIRRAIKYVQLKYMIEQIPNFRVFMTDKSLEVSATRTKPLKMQYTDPENGENKEGKGAISLGTFIRYKPWVAIKLAQDQAIDGEEAVVTHDMITDTAKKPAKTKAAQLPPIPNATQARAYLSELVAYLKKEDTFNELLEACKGAEGDDMVTLIHRADRGLAAVCSRTSAKYNRLVARAANQEEAEEDAA